MRLKMCGSDRTALRERRDWTGSASERTSRERARTGF
jgi:hypothetical protein